MFVKWKGLQKGVNLQLVYLETCQLGLHLFLNIKYMNKLCESCIATFQCKIKQCLFSKKKIETKLKRHCTTDNAYDRHCQLDSN